MRRPEPRLSRKLLAWLLGPLALLLVLDTAVAGWNALRHADQAYDRGLQEVAREIVLHVRGEGGAARFELPPPAARVLLDDGEDRRFFRVRGADGALLAGDATLPAPPAGVGVQPVFYDDRVAGAPVRMLAVRLPLAQGADAPLALVQVAETLHQRRRLAWELVADVLWPQLLLVAITGLVVWFGVSRGLAPLQRLRGQLASRSHLDLGPMPLADVPAEVRPLVQEVNGLMARLARTFDFQNRFVADAAHQLKTPVSGLKAQIELALRETEPQRVQHSLAQLATSVDRLSRLVRQLLSLARNEPGALDTVDLQPLDLHAFALEVSMEWVPHAIKRNIDLGYEGAGMPLVIAADRDRLRELINNLIDNAIRYSEPGGRVTVRTAAGGQDHVQLSISDDGPRIPVEERARIFERFHRLLGTPEDGSGLGLAIVSEIATLHRARITLEEDTDGIGNTFSVWFRRHGAVSL
jgi:two-component system sensor histidine kinase TctE